MQELGKTSFYKRSETGSGIIGQGQLIKCRGVRLAHTRHVRSVALASQTNFKRQGTRKKRLKLRNLLAAAEGAELLKVNQLKESYYLLRSDPLLLTSLPARKSIVFMTGVLLLLSRMRLKI